MANELPLDPTLPNFEALVEQRLYTYAEEYSIETFPSEHRNHLGASAIGEECWRKLWYQFRWVKLAQAEGRMRRLWNRGHREEEIFEGFLFWAGFCKREIHEPFSKVNGHYGGTPDDRWVIAWAQDFKLIVDYKTFSNKRFEQIKKEKVRVSNPHYFAQLCSYGEAFDVGWGMIFGVNKDNDEWYFELVKLDKNYAIELENKARDIIYAKLPPLKIKENPAYYKCKPEWCSFAGICHYGEKIEKNCRSCVNAVPTDKGTWTCNKWNAVIPKDEIPKGCDSWSAIV